MSDDWQPGDVAVALGDKFAPEIRKDGQYVVTAVTHGWHWLFGALTGLAFAGKYLEPPYVGWDSRAFRKLPPPEPLEEPREVGLDRERERQPA